MYAFRSPPQLSSEWVSNINQVTYEIQPPSYTSLKVLTGPPRGGGGDTLWASQYAVYDLLSPGMQKYLEGLEALHSAQIQADGSIALGRTVRREPVVTKHPLTRTHPVTGWKSVFFNPGEYLLGARLYTSNELRDNFGSGENSYHPFEPSLYSASSLIEKC